MMTDFNAAATDFDSFVQLFDSHGRRIGNAQLLGDPPAGQQLSAVLALLSNGALAAGFFTRGGVSSAGHTQHVALDRAAAMHDGGTLVLPLDIELNDLDGSETLARIEIAGVPAGGSIAGPAGTTAAFDAGSGVWTIAGSFSGALTLGFTSPAGLLGDVVLRRDGVRAGRPRRPGRRECGARHPDRGRPVPARRRHGGR